MTTPDRAPARPRPAGRDERPPAHRGGQNALTKPGWLGQPVWMWLVGGVVVIGGYLYLRSRSAASTPTAGQACTDANGNPGTTDANGNCVPATAASPTGTSQAQLLAWIMQHQGSPAPAPAPAPQPGGKVTKPPAKPPAKPPEQVKHTEYKAPTKGRTLSLAQVAKRYHTTPERIIQASSGKGNPHGHAWLAYVHGRNWNRPLPHGTNLDIKG